MANLSQSINNYLGGISQQPDYDKTPGMLSDLINGYPDITYGLRKRPGLKYEFSLGNTSDLQNGKWFSVARPNGFPYLGVILPNDKIRVWNLVTRVELTTSSSFEYIKINDKTGTTLNHSSYKVVSIQNATVVLNRNSKVDQSADNTPGTAPLPDDKKVTTYADLAEITPTTGDIYEITNTPNRNEDNYYVKWTGNAWEECAKAWH